MHFLRELEMTCKVLATRASLDRHTGVNLAVEVSDTMKEFGLEDRAFMPVFITLQMLISPAK